MTRALVPLTDGVEEMEAVIVIDVLRRAGWTVTAAGMHAGLVTASRGVRLQPDASWDELDLASFDIIVIPGGRGAETLAADERLLMAVREFKSEGKWLAAICAAPVVLHAAGVLDGLSFTCYPSTAGEIKTGHWRDEKVVVDGRVVTSQGPGTAFDFALALIRLVDGGEVAGRVASQIAVGVVRKPYLPIATRICVPFIGPGDSRRASYDVVPLPPSPRLRRTSRGTRPGSPKGIHIEAQGNALGSLDRALGIAVHDPAREFLVRRIDDARVISNAVAPALPDISFRPYWKS